MTETTAAGTRVPVSIQLIGEILHVGCGQSAGH
jgi:hypothetical protein